MTTPTVALVEMIIPSVDPLIDGMSVSLVYQVDGAIPADLVANCPGLFNVTGAGASLPLHTYLAPCLDRGTNHSIINVYDLDGHLSGTAHGSPIATGFFTLGAASGQPSYPEGLACCVNYRSDYGTDVEFQGPRAEGAGGTRPRSRDRNRHYFGPLTIQAFTAPTDGSRVKFTTQFMTDVLANTKQVEVITGTGTIPDQWNLQVWSRKGAFVKPVAEYWTDDRPDYQRRRSDAPGTRVFLAA